MSHIAEAGEPAFDDFAPIQEGPEVPQDIPKPVIQLKFNSVGLPIGPGARQAINKLGSLIRSQIPVTYTSWRLVPSTRKDLVWEDLKTDYNFTDSQRCIIMRKGAGTWKKFKAKLRKRLSGVNVRWWIDAMPKEGVKPEDWLAFCRHENTPRQRALREKNKRIKNSSVRKSTHNTGRYGYAQAEQNFKDENNGRNPLRVELWLYTHKKKGGGYAADNVEYAMKLEALLEIMRDKGNVETLDSGPLFDTLGADKGGSTRCVGSTISRKALLASSFARQMLEEVDLQQVEWRDEMRSLKADNQQLLAEVKELAEGLKNGRYSNHMATRPSSPSIPASSRPSSSNPVHTSQYFRSIPCEVRSHTGAIVAFGVKTPRGTTNILNGHLMGENDVKVLLDRVINPAYEVWGGVQDGAATLGDVIPGTVLYWHDDFLPPILPPTID